ncbi:MAG: hypothetical protein U9Q68_02225 [Euryarchaeota archaeon]|nr:hypothetical protein [Euryarchaeota archaeon]
MKAPIKMGLILKKVLHSGGVFVPEGAVNIFLSVPKSFLSAPYELQDDAVVLGEVLGVEEVGGEFEADEMIGKGIELVLRQGYLGSDDWLHFSRNSWPLLRDYGIFPDYFRITVILKEIRIAGKTIPIYPKRDVMA